VLLDPPQRGVQVRDDLLRADDPDRAGRAAGHAGQPAPAARGDHEGAGLGDRVDAGHDDVGGGAQLSDLVRPGRAVHGQDARLDGGPRRFRTGASAHSSASGQRAAVVRDFKRAWEAQDIDALIGLLDPAATAVADGGGLAVTFLSRIEGGEQIAGAWMEIARRRPETMTFSERTVNGQPGLVAEQGGTVVTVFAFDVVGDRITRIWVVRNPEKLSHRTAA
jgi:hypothetical protein